MTALCGGGASEPVAGYTGTITLDGTSIAAYLALIGEAAAAETLAPLIAGAVLVVEVFCSGDPPADPGINSTTVQNALDFGHPAVSIPAIGQIKDWFLHQYWCQVCTCTSGTAPTCGTPSSPGAVTQNPGLPQQGNAQCFDNSYTIDMTDPGSGVVVTDLTQKFVPVAGTAVTVTDGSIGGGAGVTMQMWPLQPGVTRIDFHGSVTQFDSAAPTSDFYAASMCFGSSTSAGTCTAICSTDNGLGSIQGQSFPRGNIAVWPSTATYWGISSRRVHGTTGTPKPQSIAMEAIAQCTQASLGCCPPPPTDPNISSRLDQIYGLVQNLYSIIPVRVPNYAAGAAHSGLSDGGTLALASTTIALRVVFDTLPVAYGEVIGVPNTFIDIGWISPVTNEGVEAGVRVTRSTQVIALPEASSAIDYTFPSGASVTITELQAG